MSRTASLRHQLATSVLKAGLSVLFVFIIITVSYLVINPAKQNALGVAIWALLYSAMSWFVVYWLQEKLEKQPFNVFGLHTASLNKLALGLAIGAATYTTILLAEYVTGAVRFGEVQPNAGSLLGINGYLLSGVFMCLGIAVGEELLMRGYLFDVLRRRYGVTAGMVTSSIVFALMHMPDGPRTMLQILNIIPIACIMVLLYIESGTLWAPIGFHWVWNWLSLYLAPVARLGQPGWLLFTATKNGAGPENSIMSFVLLTLLCLVFVMRLVKKGQQIKAPFWSRESSVITGVWTAIFTATLVVPHLFTGSSFDVVPLQRSVAVETLTSHPPITPSHDTAANWVRAPLAWQQATGKGIQVTLVSTAGSTDLAANEAEQVLAAVAPGATMQQVITDTNLSVQGKPLAAHLTAQARVVVFVNVALFDPTMLKREVKQLLSAQRVVVINQDSQANREGLAQLRELQKAGALVVGGLLPSGLIRPNSEDKAGADVYAPFGAHPPQAAALVAAGVATMVMEHDTSPRTAVSAKQQIIAAAIRRWQITDETGGLDENLLEVDAAGMFQAHKSRQGQPLVFRHIDAARAVGVDLAVPWAVNVMQANAAWPSATGKDVKVAVIGGGFQLERPNLQGHTSAYTGLCDLSFESYNSPQGTLVAESILAVAPDVNLLAALVVEGDEPLRFAAAIKWAVEQSAHIIAIPYGSKMNSPVAHQAIAQATQQGVLVIWPAYSGNNPDVLKSGNLPGSKLTLAGIPYPSWEFPLIGSVLPELAGEWAGVAALAKQVEPQLKGARLQQLLLSTGTRIEKNVWPNALGVVQAAQQKDARQ